MTAETRLLRGIGRLFRGNRPLPGSRAEVLENAAVLLDRGQIAWVGEEAELPKNLQPEEETDLGGALVTPGLVDAHTHPLYGGQRFEEISLRSAGASYSEIAAGGGGISSTVEQTRAASPTELEDALDKRLSAWLSSGTTTMEAKTGYHLHEAGELEAVSILASRTEGGSGPLLEVTYLGGHGVGPEWAGDQAGYARQAAAWAPAARTAGARHIDVFCDAGYFTLEESRQILSAGIAAGLIPRIHADEIALTGGALLAAELGCASADHLLRIDEAGIAALGAAGVVATLAPVTALAMGTPPPARQLLEAGVVVALGSDHNPGTCGTTDMSLVIALGVAELGLSVEEAILAATTGGAQSLRLSDRGEISPGKRADLVCWDAEHEGAFAWSYGLRPLEVYLGGSPKLT